MAFTRTYALLKVSKSTYDEIRNALMADGWDHAIHFDVEEDVELIDMNSVMLCIQEDEKHE